MQNKAKRDKVIRDELVARSNQEQYNLDLLIVQKATCYARDIENYQLKLDIRKLKETVSAFLKDTPKVCQYSPYIQPPVVFQKNRAYLPGKSSHLPFC